MKDTHGRTIDYLRISLTDRCNFRCIYCMPEEGVDQLSHKDILRFGEIVEIARVAAQMGIKRLRLTGGEPLVRKGVEHLVRELKDIPGIESIAMTTNGVLLPPAAAVGAGAFSHRHVLDKAHMERPIERKLREGKIVLVETAHGHRVYLDGIEPRLERSVDAVECLLELATAGDALELVRIERVKRYVDA